MATSEAGTVATIVVEFRGVDCSVFSFHCTTVVDLNGLNADAVTVITKSPVPSTTPDGARLVIVAPVEP